MALTPWDIGQSNNAAATGDNRIARQRNDALEDHLTEPMRRYRNTIAEGQAGMQNAELYMQQGLVPSASGNPMMPPAAPRRYNSTQPGNKEFFDQFIGTVQDNGVTNPYALAAIAATGQAESGWSRVHDEWDDPSESGQAGRSGLAMSWRGPRLQAAREFARARGDNPNKPSAETQAAFFLQENPQLTQQLNAAPDLKSAINLMRDAWRYADKGGSQTNARLELGNHYLGVFGGNRYTRNQLDRQITAAAPQAEVPQQVDENGVPYRLEPMSRTDAQFLMAQPDLMGRIKIDPTMQRSPDGKLMFRIYGDASPTMSIAEVDDNEEEFDPSTGM